ncbi:MAG: PVC-type heme-binding CxxCH protein, partial [Planctomycetota bacterium]
MAFTLDDRARLWVAEGHSYPHRRQVGRDNIIILEDEDRDGRFEKRTVFAEKLNLVSGLEIGFGGVWVGAPPYLLFIPDRDRDDVPDGEPEIVLDGFGYEDTHETLNSFIWGPDGWLYGCHGIFTHSKVGPPGTPEGERVKLNAGVWRLHPTRRDFEVFAWGSSNPWGLDFDADGEAFITACVIPHLYHIIQGARYQRQAGRHFEDYVYDDIKTVADHLHHGGRLWTNDHFALADSAGGGHAHCGALIYLEDQFPAQYRNKVLMHNVHGNRVNVDRLERSGSGFVGRHEKDFLLANDRWFRGIDFQTGPDGSIYFSDWYDKQACHLLDAEIWDRSNGRIFNVRYGKADRGEVDLAAASDAELVASLSKSEWYARRAQRLLQERGTKGNITASLRELFEKSAEKRIRLRALWTLHATSGLDEELTLRALRDPSETIRAWAIRLAGERRSIHKTIQPRLVQLASDSSARVRLALASASGRIPPEQRWPLLEVLARHESDAKDANLPLMIWYALGPIVSGDAERAVRLSRSTGIPLLKRYIYRRLASEVAQHEVLIRELGEQDDDADRRAILDEVLAAFQGRVDLKAPKSWAKTYDVLRTNPSNEMRDLADEIAVRFGDRRVFPTLRKMLANQETRLAERRRALEILRDGEDAEALSAFLIATEAPELRLDAIRALKLFGSDEVPEFLLSRYAKYSRREKESVLQTLASRVPWANALLAAVETKTIPRRDLSAFAVRQISAHGDAKLDELVGRVWGSVRTTSAERREEIDRLKKLLSGTSPKPPSPVRGRALFSEKCSSCHRLFGSGGQVAPDLTGSNRADLDYVLENVV